MVEEEEPEQNEEVPEQKEVAEVPAHLNNGVESTTVIEPPSESKKRSIEEVGHHD